MSRTIAAGSLSQEPFCCLMLISVLYIRRSRKLINSPPIELLSDLRGSRKYLFHSFTMTSYVSSLSHPVYISSLCVSNPSIRPCNHSPIHPSIHPCQVKSSQYHFIANTNRYTKDILT